MKIGGNRPAAPATRAGTAGPKDGGSKASAPPVAAAPDTASVMGIPEAELTPRVRAAIMTLMAEVDRLRREVEHVKGRLAEAEALADLDPLTGVLNRRAFVREMSRIMAFAERYAVPASLIYFDLDNFKQINDAHGHAAGDAALAHLGQLLQRNVRESDVVGRLGGDEFAVILAKAAPEIAQTKAERLAAAIRDTPAMHGGQALALSFSFGTYAFQSGVSATDALAQADRAMYAAKKSRKAPAKR